MHLLQDFINCFMTEDSIVYKPVHWFLEQTNKLVLYVRHLRHERVQHFQIFSFLFSFTSYVPLKLLSFIFYAEMSSVCNSKQGRSEGTSSVAF